MKYLIPIILLFTACQYSPRLQVGQWAGSLTPMNHPEMQLPVTYEVSYNAEQLQINLIGPDSSVTLTNDPYLRGDTLYFSFNEPEEQVFLQCALAKQSTAGFAGRCTDPSGKWAQFTMAPAI